MGTLQPFPFDEAMGQSTLPMPHPETADGLPPQPSVEPESVSHDNKPTDTNMPSITVLPNELLMQVARNLACEKVEPYLDGQSFDAYVQAQTDLRNFCLVSKQMDAAAREYLYRAAIVRNPDVLVYLARTLDEQPTLGQHVKQLVFEIPWKFKDGLNRKLDVAVLRSRPNYATICGMADRSTNVDEYNAARVYSTATTLLGMESSDSFKRWIWNRESDALRALQYEIILRSRNLESLGFGMICSVTLPPLPSSGNHGLLYRSKLQHLQLLGVNRDAGRPFPGSFLRCFLQFPSLRTLSCVRDDGHVYRLSPRQEIGFPMPPPPSWQCRNITSLDFQRSHCTPAAIYQLCVTFPSLERLSISVERRSEASSYTDKYVHGFGTTKFLSTGLASLEHLRELRLDLHYKHDVNPLLGEHELLNLGGLTKLTHVRIPLHCLVKQQPGDKVSITNLAVVLPPSVTHLTVWADLYSVVSWSMRPTTSLLTTFHPTSSPMLYIPRESALDFLEGVHGLLTCHFKQLKEVTYCYGDDDPGWVCTCTADSLCARCEASRLLDIQASGDSATRMGAVASDFEARGVCLRTLQEPSHE